MEPVEITAGRLHLRPFAAADADAIYAACQEPDIQKWTRVPSAYTLADAQHFLTRSPEGWQKDTAYSFAVCDSVSGDLLAAVGLRPDASDNIAEIGYWCASWARRQRVTSEAVGALCRWGFGALELARIECHIAVGNDVSRRLAEHVGFTIEGVSRSRLLLSGIRYDAWIAGLLPDDVR